MNISIFNYVERKSDALPLYSSTPCGVEAELVSPPRSFGHSNSPSANRIIISPQYDRLVQVLAHQFRVIFSVQASVINPITGRPGASPRMHHWEDDLPFSFLDDASSNYRSAASLLELL